jgi:hypothetical protein
MKKILISEHADHAAAFISELEKEYLSAIRTVCSNARSLGIEITTKELLFDLINGNFDQFQATYWQTAQLDVDNFKSPAAKEQMKLRADETLGEFLKSIPLLFSPDIDNRSMSDPYFQQFVELSDSGPIIPDPTREKILESFKEYATNAKVVKLYEAQQEAAKALQNFINSLTDAKMDTGLYFGPAAPWSFLSRCFEVIGIKDETDTIINGIEIKPRQLDYNYLKKD